MLVKTGLSKLGYRYVVPQDCMFSGRAPDGASCAAHPSASQ
eukprot:COSAG06_NODE_119_length_23111_cov_51.658613_16_plen_41_part_00